MKNHKKILIGLGVLISAIGLGLLTTHHASAADQPFPGTTEWRNAQYTMNNKSTIIVTFPSHGPETFNNDGSDKKYNPEISNTGICSGSITFNSGQSLSSKPIKATINIKFANSQGTPSCVNGGDNWNTGISITNNTSNGGGTPADTGPKSITYNGQAYTQINTGAGGRAYGLSGSIGTDCYGGALLILDKLDSAANAPVKATVLYTILSSAGTELSSQVSNFPTIPLDVASVGRCHYDSNKANSDNQLLSVKADGSATFTGCSKGDTSCQAASTGDPGGGGASATGPTCESNSASSFTWIMCPALDLLDDMAGQFNSFVEGQLCFSTGQTSSTGGVVCDGNNNLNSGVKKAWSVFRNIATALLVIVMLLMVFSQAIGGGIFDAYTVRKMLPKLVAAVILMQISWVLFKWTIDLSNDLGTGIKDLLFAPFGGPDKFSLQTLIGTNLSNNSGAANNTFALLAIFAAGIGVIALSIPGLLLMGLYMVLALLTAFIVLVFRKLLIVLLVILAPVALIAWILPGTERYWKLWSTNFTKLLLMFPMIMALIAAGRIFAGITAGTAGVVMLPHLSIIHLGPLPVPSFGSITNFADFAIIIAAYFGPYFLLPQTYKWGGQAMGAIGKGVPQAMERLGGKQAKDYLQWRQGLSPWKQARAARRAEVERKNKLGFYEGLGAAGTRGKLRRARLAGIETPGSYKAISETITRRGRQQVEAEELKAAQESLLLEISQAKNHDELVRNVALGNAGATWEDTSGNIHTIGARSDWEQAAAIGELARLGGAGNMRTIQEVHARAQADTTDRGGRRREMVKKALDANADKLLGPLKHLYYGMENVGGTERINVHSTIEGLKPAGIAAMDGVEMETLLGELDTRLRTYPSGTPEHRQALADLATLTSTYYQAITNESIRPNVGLGVSRAMKVYTDGSSPERVAEIRNSRIVGGTPIPGSPVRAGGTPLPGLPVIDVDPATGIPRRAIDPTTGTTTPLGTELVGLDPSLLTALSHIHTHVDTSGNASV